MIVIAVLALAFCAVGTWGVIYFWRRPLPPVPPGVPFTERQWRNRMRSLLCVVLSVWALTIAYWLDAVLAPSGMAGDIVFWLAVPWILIWCGLAISVARSGRPRALVPPPMRAVGD